MNNHASMILSVVAISISGSAFLFSILSFAWQHLRKVDSVICTLVANEVNDKQGTFQFSFANLGNRPALLRNIEVEVFDRPELNGVIIGNSAIPAGNLPQVIKAGEIFSTVVETKLTETDLVLATKEAEQRGCASGVTELFFVAKVTVWNPEGKRSIGTKHIVTFCINHKERSSTGETFNERAFQVSRDFGLLGSERLRQYFEKIRDLMRS